MEQSLDKIAVLIDGDNAEASLIEHILNEASKLGRLTIKRIYGDFTSNLMNGWKDQLNLYAIRPIQKFAYTKGKNSTDSALIIDAMDILHANQVTGFCIVSSDSDYTGLAHRIREQGFFVMGIGKSTTPEAFVKACESFTYTEILSPKMTKQSAKLQPKEENQSIKKIDFEIVESAFEMVKDEMTGEALASRLGIALKRIDPTFDIRNYRFPTFRKFLEALKPKFETIIQKDGMTISIKKNTSQKQPE